MYESVIDTVMDNLLRNTEVQFSEPQRDSIRVAIQKSLSTYDINPKATKRTTTEQNQEIIESFLAAKSLEGCSDKTLHYYRVTIEETIRCINIPLTVLSTDDLRRYLGNYQSTRHTGRVTMDNIRRILSSFFTWLEDEDYIIKSPVRKIHKVKIAQTVKETLTDEEVEKIREACTTLRDLAIIDMLISTGMRVGELVLLNKADINYQERECKVLGKGNKEREVYFDAKAKMHIEDYLASRKDSDPALFVELKEPHTRMTISGIEVRVKAIGLKAIGKRVHPHKFRRTLATMAIDKGMPIEQVQTLLGHVKIDTTLHYAMVNQENVKISHRKYIE